MLGIASQLFKIYECSAMNLTWNSFKRPNISMIISFCGKMVVLDTKSFTKHYECSVN